LIALWHLSVQFGLVGSWLVVLVLALDAPGSWLLAPLLGHLGPPWPELGIFGCQLEFQFEFEFEQLARQ